MASGLAVTSVVEVSTSVGPARWHVDAARGDARALLVLGHGAGGGVDATDLQLLASALPGAGVTVARFEQPWRVAGRRVAAPPAQLDLAWSEALPELPALKRGAPLVVGGRSAGARVACRTARSVGAAGVLALAFPLHTPGRPERSRAAELVVDRPLLVVQGTRDAFGRADELEGVLSDAGTADVAAVVGADHSLRVARSGPLTQGEADEVVLLAVRRWVARLTRAVSAVGNQPGPDGR